MRKSELQLELEEAQFMRELQVALDAKSVGPRARSKLRHLLAYYRKKPHPFTSCVRDNRKRFGPGTERVCATLKDIIVGHTKWRKGRKKGLAEFQDETDGEPRMDQEVYDFLVEIDRDEDLRRFMMGRFS